MVDAERIKELEKLDKRLKTRRRLTRAFIVTLSVLLVIYAVSIERKIDRLSENPAVVIYSDASDDDITEEKDDAHISADASVGGNITSAENDNTAEKSQADTSGENKQLSDRGQVYYVTASGKKYHKDGCSYLTKSKIEITYDDMQSGGYAPCSRCIKD